MLTRLFLYAALSGLIGSSAAIATPAVKTIQQQQLDSAGEAGDHDMVKRILPTAESETEQAETEQEADPEPVPPSESTPKSGMTAERLGQIARLIDANAKANGNSWQFSFQDRRLYLVYDVPADRMRLMSPIIEASELTDTLMYRMLQANYDAVLDPRYAIAKGVVWSVFIHPLAALSNEQLASAIAQVHTAAETFGTSYTSGGLVFGGGDSQGHHRRLLEQVKKILNPTT